MNLDDPFTPSTPEHRARIEAWFHTLVLRLPLGARVSWYTVRMPSPLPAPREPADKQAYLDLLGRCIEARDRQALIALMPEIVRFEGGLFEDDFKREWLRNWTYQGLRLVDVPAWPKGGPFSRHQT